MWSLTPKNCDVDGVIDRTNQVLVFNIRRSFLQREAMTFDDFHPVYQKHGLIFQMYLELCHECITWHANPPKKKKKDGNEDDEDEEMTVDEELRYIDTIDDRIDKYSLLMETVFDRASEV